MTKHGDRVAWAVAIGLLACLALLGGLLAQSGRDQARRAPAPTTPFFAVTLA